MADDLAGLFFRFIGDHGQAQPPFLQRGHARRLDELGRIVIPIDVRRALSLNERDTVMFFLDEKSRTVILKKEFPSCICCHAADSLRQLPHGIYVCESCLAQLS